ncbi:ABC transporter ATP-binding protein [uncultured Actinomyces sp.]|uniref:ABC transporter ATP-binding protein n=1 Tax=uncultured Actinomyces sp. TaxID=249061 RepID=UPI0028E76D38|nr:ABC transporter ATP-binding protein [uncultured Actinomyces sp.]
MRFWDLIGPVRGLVVSGVTLQGLGAVAGLVPMVASVQLSTALVDRAPAGETWRWLWVALAGIAVRTVLIGTGLMLTHLADARLNRDLRVRLTAHLGRIPIGEASRRSSGRVKKLVTDDVHALHTLVAHAGGDMVVGVVTAVAALAVLLLYSWPLALVALLPLAGFLTVFGSMMGKAATQFRDWDEAKARVSSATVEFAHGIAVVKTFGQAGRASADYRRAVDDYADFFGRLMVPMVGASSLGLAIVSAPSVLATMGLLGLLLLQLGWVDFTGFVAGLVLGVGLAGPLTQMDSYDVRLRAAREAAARIGEFLATPVLPVPDAPAAAEGGEVVLDDVSFAYDPHGPDTLSQVAMRIPQGTVTALVGRSGAGKSTLAALVPRFWDVRDGAVRVGGQDVRDLEPAALYRSVAFVFQGTRLVPMSVRDNIRLARPGAGDEEVVAAASAAGIHDRVAALPRGYDSVVGVDALLSGGEAQRVTIARALLEDAPVLVLDEPTSFADPENEVRLQAAVARAAEGRTVLVIAHRLTSVTAADQIAVMEAGRVVEVGTHAELLARAGAYRGLWQAGHVKENAA